MKTIPDAALVTNKTSAVLSEPKPKSDYSDVSQKKSVGEQPIKSNPIATQSVKTEVLKPVEEKIVSVQNEAEKKETVEQPKKEPPILENEKEAQKKIVDTIKLVQNEINVTNNNNAAISNPKANIENK